MSSFPVQILKNIVLESLAHLLSSTAFRRPKLASTPYGVGRMKMLFVTVLMSVTLLAQCKADALSDLDAMEERKPRCSGSGRNNTCDRSDKVDRIYLALSDESKNVEQTDQNGQLITNTVSLPVISVIACYQEDPNPMHVITSPSGEKIKLNDRFYLSDFNAKTVIENKGEEIPNGQCEILVKHQDSMLSAVNQAQAKSFGANQETLISKKTKNGSCMGAAGLAFAALTISNPIALGTLAAGTLQTGLLCSSNIHRVEDSEETMAEFNANSILARYLLLVQSSLVRQLRNSYEQVKNAKTPEALASFTTITTRDADLFQLWSRVEKDLPDNRKMENTTPLSDEERIQLVKRLYNRIVKAFNSDLSIEDEILRCERYDSLPKDRNGRSIIEQVDDSLKCESYTEVDKTEGIWKARDAYEAEVMMKPEKDLAIKQILGNPRSLHDFFRSGLIRTMEGQPGVFEQNGRSFTNYIRKVYLRDIYRECTTLDGSVFYDRTTTPISEKCEVIYQMSYKDKFIRLGAGESSTKTDPGSETVPTASLR